MYDDLTMDQIFHSYSVRLLDKCSIINIEKKYLWVPTSQGVHDSDFELYDEYKNKFIHCM